MKRTKLQQALRRIKTRTPRWFWKRCSKCRDEYKHEPMFCVKVPLMGTIGGTFNLWNCTSCCSTKADVIENNHVYFGTIDVSPLRDRS